MKHLLNFDTVAEYDAAKDSLEQPCVVTIDENNGLQYNTDVIRVPAGSGGGSGSVSSWRYYDVSALGSSARYAADAGLLIKGYSSETDGTIIYTQYGLIANNDTDVVVLAIAFDESVEIVIGGGIKMTWGELAAQMIPKFIQIGAREITKEEFYGL